MRAMVELCRQFLAQAHGQAPAAGAAEERDNAGQGMVTDWDELQRLSRFHRVAPLIGRMLQASGSLGAPPEVVDWFRRESREAATRNLFLTAELLRIDEALVRRGITCVPNKGPVLAQELYGDVSLRVFGDLDLVLEPASVPAALEALFNLGYAVGSCRAEPPSTELLLKFAATLRGEIPLIHPQSRVQVDLHWNILGRKRLKGYSLARSISPRRLPLADRSLLRFKTQDLFIFLSLHGFKHAWARFNWLVDLAMLLRSEGKNLDWPGIASRLDDQAAVATLTGVFLCHDLLGVDGFPLEKFFREPLTERARKLAQALAATYQSAQGTASSPEFATLFSLNWRANLTPLAKLGWLAGHMGLIGFEDLDRLRLPIPLFWLYYPARGIRLAGKFLLPSRGENQPAIQLEG